MITINQVEPTSPLEWYKRGWGLFTADIKNWVIMAVILGAIFIVLGFIPFLGGLVLLLIMPLLQGGLLIAAQKADNGEAINFMDIFALFQDEERRNPLLILGALMLAVGLVVSLVLGGSMAATAGAGTGMGSSNLGEIGTGTLLVGFLVSIFMGMLFLFAPALVVFDKLSPVEAIKHSFSGSLKNIIAFILFMLIYTILAFLGAIPFGLGLLVVIPLTLIATYTGYDQIFDADLKHH